jgi:Domain of unknown function (DUF5615)
LARFYSNENFLFATVEALRRLGHDVLTTLGAGKTGQAVPDEAVLQFAVSEGRCVLTINRRDFIKLHTKHPDHTGILVCKFDTDYQGLAERIHTMLRTYPNMDNQLVRINRIG